MFLATSLAAPALIDLDGTVFLQLGIFLVMFAALYVLLFRPYLRVRGERERGIGGARAEATAMEERAAAIVIDYETRVAKARQRGADERGKLRAEGVAHEQRVLGAAHEAAKVEIDAARAGAATARDGARASLLAESSAIGRRVATRVLGREV